MRDSELIEETKNSINSSFVDDDETNQPLTARLLKLCGWDKDPRYIKHYEETIAAFLEEVFSGRIPLTGKLSHNITARLAEIDSFLTAEINEILHHPDFQALEATWRNLHRLVKSTHYDPNVKIRILDTTKEEILLDAECAADFDTTGLFKLFYEDGYGTFGGDPYGVIVSDFEFTKSLDDLECLKAIARVASAAHAPFIASASPELFGLSSFADLEKIKSLEKLFKSSEFNSWNSFRAMEESKYIVLTLPKFITRLPYGEDGIRVKEFNFKEKLGNKEDDKFVWGSSAFLLAEKIIHSFQNYGWFQNIRGFEGGGVVADLPVYQYKDELGNKFEKSPAQVILTDRRERELEYFGFLPLSYKKNGNFAVFFSSTTIHKVREYESDLANANAYLITELPYLLSMSRFAHYLKVIAQNKIGSFTSKEDLDNCLNKWISKYVLADDEASQKEKNMRPLREARINVVSVPGMPGVYRTFIYIRPHYYLKELTISLRLVSYLI